MSNISIIPNNFNLKKYEANNLSFEKITVDINNNLLYINVSINYINSSLGTDTTYTVVPVYISEPEFADYINVKQLRSYIIQLFGVTETTPPVESEYKYIPLAP